MPGFERSSSGATLLIGRAAIWFLHSLNGCVAIARDVVLARWRCAEICSGVLAKGRGRQRNMCRGFRAFAARSNCPTDTFFWRYVISLFFFFNLDFPIVTLLLLICCYVISRTIGELRPFETAFLNIRRIKNLKKNSPRYPPGLAFLRCWDYQPIRAGERSARLFVWGVT